jgi:repressor LexA
MTTINKTTNSLTERQQLILDYISTSIKERGYPPTLREICKFMGIRSTNGVSDHLRALKRKGYLERTRLKSRAMTLTKPNKEATAPNPVHGVDGAKVLPFIRPVTDTVDVPLLGRVAPGQPLLVVEGCNELVKIDRFFLGPNTEVFAVRFTGNSMYEAGILDEDFIFLRQMKARPGDIVLVALGEEVMLRYFHPEGARIRFQPANCRLEPVIVFKDQFKEVQILGVVVGMQRRLSLIDY